MAEGEKDNGALYVLLGCAGLLIVGLCAASGLGVWMVVQRSSVPPVAYPSGPAMPPPVPPPVAPTVPPPGTPLPPGPALPPPPDFGFSPAIIRATVESVEGTSPVAVGATCEFTVERHARPEPPGYWCRTQIACGGRLLYGGPTAGYFPCELGDSPRTVVGRDIEATSVDTDAAMELDTTTGVLSVRDDVAGPYGSYAIRARITETR